MQTEKRASLPGVIEELIAEPHRFGCAQTVRLLLRWLRRHGVAHQQAFEKVLRFDNSISLAFPASEIESLRLEVRQDGVLVGAAPHRIHITPAFIGLLGGQGAMPLNDTQRMSALPAGEAAAGARAFLDLISQRMVALFCQGWGKYRLEYTLDTQGRDGQLPMLLALSGASRTAPEAEQHAAAYYTAWMRSRPVSAGAIRRLLAGHFGVPMEIEQFAGCWDYLPDEQRSTLARTGPRLGYGAMLGVRLWRQDRQVRVNIGPMDRTTLERFLPNGAAAAALARMLAILGAPSLRYEVRLILKSSCIAPVVLGPPAARRRLGWDSFLPCADGTVARPEVRYLLRL